MSARGVELVVEPDAAAVAERVAELLVGGARAGQEIVLSGGSTPGRSYERAAELEPDWSRAGVWWGDERCVPPGDVTASRSSTGCIFSSRSSFAVPSIVCTTSCVDVSRPRPSRIPASIIASASSAK